jgi:hypothetical protein
MNKKKMLTMLMLSLVTLVGCVKTLPVTGGKYAGSDAAEIVVIRQIGGSQCQAYTKVDGEVVCMLPEWGNWTKFTLKPGLHKFEAFCHERKAKWEPKSFNIEPGAIYYFQIHQRMAEFHKPTMRISEITEIEANDLLSQKDKYEYVQANGTQGS